MKSICMLLFITSLSAGYVSGQTKITIERKDTIDKPFNKLMILSLLPNQENRKIIESEVSYWINKNGHSAFPFSKFSENQKLPTREEIDKIVSEQEFDAILVMQVSDIEKTEKFERSHNRGYYYPGYPTFYNYLDVYYNQYSIGYTYMQSKYILETRLFDSSAGAEVLNMVSSSYEGDNLDLVIEEFAKKMAKTLKKTKMLAIKEQ